LRALVAGVTDLVEREVTAARSGPVFERPPSTMEVDRIVDSERALPADGESVQELLAACAAVLGAGRRTTPGFFGYVQSPPAPVAVAADLLASAADQNVTSWRSGPAATAVEHQTLRWLGEFVGFDAAASGILISGGSAANLTALLVAVRAATAPDDDRRTMRVYASAETHFSVAKAASAIGVGLVPVAVDSARRLDPAALRTAIASDRAAGLLPICVVANAGTTSTGAVDPLDAVATVAADAGVWLHVDGAYGAPAAADPTSRRLFAGLHRADSLGIDAHKWLYAPVDCSALLVHDPAATARAFGAGADDYVRVLATQPAETFAFWDHGLELSRRFRALKLWATLRFHGSRRLAAAIGEDIRLATHLAGWSRPLRTSSCSPARTERLLLPACAARPSTSRRSTPTTSGSCRRCSRTGGSTCRTRRSAGASRCGPASRTSEPRARTSSGAHGRARGRPLTRRSGLGQTLGLGHRSRKSWGLGHRCRLEPTLR
jgi:glutamate/tyrosine decarboxylase-like PLP-dependent enzyme